MGLIALIISCIANWCSFYAVYRAFKATKRLRQEIDEQDEIIKEQENLIKKLSRSNVSYCVNCSKIMCKEAV
ncbi:hypothetical protein [Bartonella tribocorum]|uniref:hypothetical protein n=1 Tax=Bartonella tribocorum TaxID=85701 RepID=UPI0003074095|nr:hypothetical protein [Bartonella tribocorum]CDO48614.1 hypothetical protein BM1374166_00931 [Bartonella tribocorum]